MQQVLWLCSSLPKDALFAKRLYVLTDRLKEHIQINLKVDWGKQNITGEIS